MTHRTESSFLIDSTRRIMPYLCATGFASDAGQRHRTGQWHTLTVVLALLLLTQIGRGRADEPASTQASVKAPRLEPVFNDDFSTDTRGQYEVKGDVSWEQGKLKLTEGASITRDINGGAWAQVELNFGDDGWASNEDSAELRIWFLLDGATNCFVRLRTSPDQDDGQLASVALFDTGETDGQPVAKLIREVPLPKALVDRLTVTYRHGLVTLTADQSVLLTSYIQNGAATVAKVRLQAAGGLLQLHGWDADYLPAPLTLTEDQRRRAAEAASANQQLIALYQQGKFAEAAEIGERVLSLVKDAYYEYHPRHIISLNNLARLHSLVGNYPRAEQLRLQSCEAAEMVFGRTHPAYADSITYTALLYTSMAKYKAAEPLFVHSCNLYKTIHGESHSSYATSLNNLAELYRQMGNYKKAEPLFLRARAIAKEIDGTAHSIYGTSTHNLALLYTDMGEYRRAESLFVEAVDIVNSRYGEEHTRSAKHTIGLAHLYQSMGEHARAEPLYLRALHIVKANLGKENPVYATNLNNLAGVYHSLGEYTRAETLYQQTRDIRKKVLGENHPDYAASLNNLASLYEALGDFARPEPLYQQSLDIRKDVLGEEHPDYASSLNNLAAFYAQHGSFVRAESLYIQARDIRKKTLGKHHPAYASSLNNLAVFYEQAGAHARAESLYKEALSILSKPFGKNHPHYAESLSNLANLYFTTGEFGRAKALYQRASNILDSVLAKEHPIYASNLHKMALLQMEMGENGSAEQLHSEAWKAQLRSAATTIPGLSEVQARCWLATKRPRTDFVLTAMRRHAERKPSDAYGRVWQTKGLIRRLRIGQSVPSDASPAVQEVFAQLRDSRLKLAKLVTATPSPEQAKDYRQALATASERKEVMEKKLAKLNTATARELAVRDATVHDLLQRLGDGVAVVDFVKLDDWKYVDAEITLENEDGHVSTRTVKMPESDPVYDAFVLRANESAERNPAKWIPLGSAKPIDASIAAWRREFAPTTAAGGKAASAKAIVDADRRLRQLIWEKVEPHLDGIHTVVIIPDGNLHRLPWAALPGRNDGEYLIHDYGLTTASSGQQLYGVLADPPIETPPQLLVAAGINYDQRPQVPSAVSEPALLAANSRPLMRSQEDFGWGRLPGTVREAAAIVEFWGDRGDVNQLSGVQANEIALSRLLPQSTFAHLATHGFFDPRGEVFGTNLREQSLFESSISGSQSQSSVAYRNPLLMTGIVMAGANVPPETDDLGLPIGDDGILTAEEISDLDLRNTELVTLSACETGLGDVAAGEGVYGLTRALHKSGARSVLASLWKVDDNATTELMKQFYTNLWEKKMSKLKALRRAQLTMLNRYDPTTGKLRGAFTGNKGKSDPNKVAPKPARAGERLDPRYWAAFQLSGDWR